MTQTTPSTEHSSPLLFYGGLAGALAPFAIFSTGGSGLAPIKSIAGSLRDRVSGVAATVDVEELSDGLSIIATRSEALTRFMASYARLARLPQPELAPLRVQEWVERVAIYLE